MKERPILFSGEMVRAILDGRKTQTRRVVTVPRGGGKRCVPWAPYYIEEDGRLLYQNEAGEYHPMEGRCPYGAEGTKLWVRETFCRCETATCFKAGDGDHENCGDFKRWKPSIHMPRALSRLLLEVKAVRVERLQEITWEDAVAEGIECPWPHGQWAGMPGRKPIALRKFSKLWDSINAKRGFSWVSNPFVWVVTFERIQ